MKNTKNKSITAALSVMFSLVATVQAQTTAFNYQGKLTDTGTPQSKYQMQFKLFIALTGDSQIGAILANSWVAINQGTLVVLLDFTSTVFSGADRFLQNSHRRNAGDKEKMNNEK
jgi:hypothetical protein